jgi:hypothetical protein
LIDSISHLPMPGQAKIVSVRIAPASSVPTCSPMTVMTGIRAFRSAWMPMTRNGDSPLARAVRT